ncbi:MAG: DNA-binding protein [Ruminococcus sp.]|nr:DNA-binding protein [Ruminococcus sp.]
MAKELKFVMLLDCYGDLLTRHQRNIMELYYCDDLSLAEIGQPMGITRQAVRCTIKRTEELLLNYEEKLRFAEKLVQLRSCFGSISKIAENINDADLKNALEKKVSEGLKLL